MLDLAAELLAVFGVGIACLVYFLVLKPLWRWLDKQPARWRRLLVPFRAIGMGALVVALFPVVMLFEWLPEWWRRVRCQLLAAGLLRRKCAWCPLRRWRLIELQTLDGLRLVCRKCAANFEKQRRRIQDIRLK